MLPLDEQTHYPVCIAGHGDCPPEECGGPSGYAALLLERGSWRLMGEVYEAMAVVAGRVRDWQQGGPRPTWDDEAFSDALERMSDWLDGAPPAFSRRQVNVALRKLREEGPCTSAFTS